MRYFFDSSVLVAAMVEDEPHHEACAMVLRGAEEGMASPHSLLECFATLTGGRLGVQLGPGEAARMIRFNVHDRLSMVTLTALEHLAVVESAGPVGARGGAVYDLLLLAAARKSGAERIWTLNTRHFALFAPDLETKIAAP